MTSNTVKVSPTSSTPLLLMDFYIFGKFYNFSLKNKPINVRKNIFPPNGVCMPSGLHCNVCKWAGVKARGIEIIFSIVPPPLFFKGGDDFLI